MSKEKAETAERFGQQRFGMSCLLAARLIDAGVRFVNVNVAGLDAVKHAGTAVVADARETLTALTAAYAPTSASATACAS